MMKKVIGLGLASAGAFVIGMVYESQKKDKDFVDFALNVAITVYCKILRIDKKQLDMDYPS